MGVRLIGVHGENDTAVAECVLEEPRVRFIDKSLGSRER